MMTSPKNITSTRDNPFCNKVSIDKLTRWQRLQIYIMSVTVAPVRFVLFFLTFLITWLFSTLFTINFTIHDKPGPLRAVSFRFLRLLGRVTLYFMGFQYVEVRGRRCTTEEAPILVYAPHSSFMDSIVFFLQSPFPSPVSRLENFHIPLLHTLLKVVRPIFVSREDPNSRQATIHEVRAVLLKLYSWLRHIRHRKGPEKICRICRTSVMPNRLRDNRHFP